MLDIFFLSYDEPNADNNWAILSDMVPARRVHGIKGIHNAHKKCAQQANTENFYVVDADSQVMDSMDFAFTPDVYSNYYTHIWKTINPFFDLQYGHGGIKLFNTAAVLATPDEMPIDFSLSVGDVKIMDEVGSINLFNTGEFETWRAAFRECAKLVLNDNDESYERLDVWTNFDAYLKNQYFRYCINGARCGEKFANRSGYNYEEVNNLINDFDKLKEHYESWHSGHIRY